MQITNTSDYYQHKLFFNNNFLIQNYSKPTRMMIKLEMLIRNIIARIFYKLEQISNTLKLQRTAKILNSAGKKIDILIYDDDDFLKYVVNKQALLYENINTLETIALRGSTADYDFHPKYFPNSYNLGLTSSDLKFTYLQYKSIVKDAKKLENIILFTSFSMIGFALAKTSEKNRLIAYHKVFNIPIPKEYQLKRKYIKHISKKLQSVSPSKTKSYLGYEIKTAFISGNKNIQTRIKTHKRENQRTPDQLNWLRKIIDESSRNKHNLFLVLPPFRTDYKENMPHFKEGYEKLFTLGIDDSNIINFHNNEIFNEDDFGDTDHLNDKGAIKLTKELYQIVKNRNYI